MAKPKTKTHAQSVNEYARRNYDSLLLSMPKGAKALLKAKADEEGVSVSRYILESVEQRSGLILTLDKGLPWISENKKQD